MKYAISVTFFTSEDEQIFRVIGGHFERESSFFASSYSSVLFYAGVFQSCGNFSFKIFVIISNLLTLNREILLLNIHKVIFVLNLNYRDATYDITKCITFLSSFVRIADCQLPLEKSLISGDKFGEFNSFYYRIIFCTLLPFYVFKLCFGGRGGPKSYLREHFSKYSIVIIYSPRLRHPTGYR